MERPGIQRGTALSLFSSGNLKIHLRPLGCSWLLLFSLAAPVLLAQAPPPAEVRYTEAREYNLRRTISLPGSVEARTASVVASEIGGVVAELLVREGHRVKEGQVLARLRTTNLELELRAAEAAHKEATARLKLAERNLERARDLHESKIFSQQQLDEQFYEYTAWRGRVDQLEAQIARLQHDIEQASIRAPFTGVVVRERTEVGEWVAEGGAVAEILALDELEIRLEVPERYFRDLKVGAPARVSFESLPGQELTGRVLSVIPRADAQARTFPVKIAVRNPRRQIGVGMLARVSLQVGEPYAATLVPKDAVVARSDRKFVYVVNGDNTVTELMVDTGTGVGAWIEINGGVRPGQRVVTRGNERLFSGQPVNGQPLAYELP